MKKTKTTEVKCDKCGHVAKEPLLECPECGVHCCENCIAGKGVACFPCEEGFHE